MPLMWQTTTKIPSPAIPLVNLSPFRGNVSAISPCIQIAQKLTRSSKSVHRFPRTIGQNGAASLMQRTVADVCNYTSDLSVYETNKKILFEAAQRVWLSLCRARRNFLYVPTFFRTGSQAFCKKAMEKDLMLVPGDIFGCPGHFRIAYCVPTERVEKALPIFQELAEEYL